MAFTEQEEKDLIQLVSENPVLYDPNEDGYHNHYVKESTWQSVGKAMQKPGEECKRKWKFIRDGYTRYKKKCNSAYPPRNAKNSRHKLLVFLDNCNAVATIEPEIQIEDNDETSQENFEPQYEFVDEKNFDFVSTDALRNNRKAKREAEESDTRASTPQSKKRQKKIYNRLENEDTIVRKREDDVDLFCRHIAEVLRNLPPLLKAKAKKDLSAVVSEYEIKAVQCSSNVADDEVSEPDGRASLILIN